MMDLPVSLSQLVEIDDHRSSILNDSIIIKTLITNHNHRLGSDRFDHNQSTGPSPSLIGSAVTFWGEAKEEKKYK